MATFTMLKSIYGRRLGLSSTGGILAGSASSTAYDSIAVMRDSTGARLSPFYEPLVSASSSGATLGNSGVSVLSSATSTALNFTLAAPVAGVGKEIISQASATAVTIDTSATTILFFHSTLGSVGATALTIAGASTDGGAYGAAIILRGVSTTKWQVMARPNGSSAVTVL